MTALTDYARLTRGLDLLRDVYEIDRRHPNSVELVSAAAHVFESTASAWLTAARSVSYTHLTLPTILLV